MSPLPASIQDDTPLKNRLRDEWILMRDPALNVDATVNISGCICTAVISEGEWSLDYPEDFVYYAILSKALIVFSWRLDCPTL